MCSSNCLFLDDLEPQNARRISGTALSSSEEKALRITSGSQYRAGHEHDTTIAFAERVVPAVALFTCVTRTTGYVAHVSIAVIYA